MNNNNMTGFELFTQLHADKIKGYTPLTMDEYIDYAKKERVDPQDGEKVFKHYFQMVRQFARYGTK
jgi:hypothetical protein